MYAFMRAASRTQGAKRRERREPRGSPHTPKIKNTGLCSGPRGTRDGRACAERGVFAVYMRGEYFHFTGSILLLVEDSTSIFSSILQIVFYYWYFILEFD